MLNVLRTCFPLCLLIAVYWKIMFLSVVKTYLSVFSVHDSSKSSDYSFLTRLKVVILNHFESTEVEEVKNCDK